MILNINDLKQTIVLLKKENEDYDYKENRICSEKNMNKLTDYLIFNVPLEARAKLNSNALKLRNFYERLLYVRIKSWDETTYNTYVYRIGDIILYIEPLGYKNITHIDDFGKTIEEWIPHYEVSIGYWGYFLGQELDKFITVSTLQEIQVIEKNN